MFSRPFFQAVGEPIKPPSVMSTRGLCCPEMLSGSSLLTFTQSNHGVAGSFLFCSPIQHNLGFTMLF